MMGFVIQYHPKYLRRLANIYLDKYEMFGHAGAAEWHRRVTGADTVLQAQLNDTIKIVAPLRGKVTKD